MISLISRLTTPKYFPNIKVNGAEDKILALYATGMTIRDIAEQIKNIYDMEISAEMVSNVTNRIIPVVSEWQNRPLKKVYSFVFMDGEN